MNNKIIKIIMAEIIQRYLEVEIDSKSAIEQLINKLDVEEIYDNEDELILSCYFAIKHLRETGFETPIAEIEYYNECFQGNRVYSLEEKNKYILDNSK